LWAAGTEPEISETHTNPAVAVGAPADVVQGGCGVEAHRGPHAVRDERVDRGTLVHRVLDNGRGQDPTVEVDEDALAARRVDVDADHHLCSRPPMSRISDVDAAELGRLGYGAANVGNLYRPMSDEDARAVLEAAWDSGIRYFDTAPHYGLGLSERRLGAFLATKPRAEYVISTKVGRLLRPSPETADRLDDENQFAVPASLRRVWDFSAGGIRASLEESLDRLGLAEVDVLYLHDPDEHDLAANLSTGVPAIAALRDEALVAAVGIGSKSTAALTAAVRTGALDLAMVAGRYTLLEQADELVAACRDTGVGIVAAAVFNSGLLATPRPGGRYEYGAVPAELLARAERIAEVCERHGVTLPEAALQFPLREPAVRSVVVGAASPQQVRENAQRMEVEIPEGLWDELRS
jgi:D-threo-aldose 1-dehydrogenase